MNDLFTNRIIKIFFLFLLIISPVFSQVVLFNNLYNTIEDYSFNDNPMAQQFKTTSSLKYIYEIELGIWRSTSSGGTFTVSIFSDNGNDEMGSLVLDLYTASYSVLSETQTVTFKIDHNNSPSLPCELSANTKYWIKITTSGGFINWNYTFDLTGIGDGFLPRCFVETMYFDDSPFMMKIVADNVLPVELSSFTASLNNDNVILNWQTEIEVNNYGFEIERSVLNSQNSKFVDQGTKFEKIGFVRGSGNSNSPKRYSFIDNQFRGRKAIYRLKQIDNDGSFNYSSEVVVEAKVPKEFLLKQNYPNPFNPVTTISFSLEDPGLTTLKIYNAIGQEVITLINNEYLEAGMYHQKVFDASKLPTGMYIARLQSGSRVQIRKMLFVK